MSVFMALLITGAALPVVSLVMSSVFDGVESLAHTVDAHVDSGFIHLSPFLPLSPTVWCVCLIVTGVLGEVLSRLTALPLGVIWAVSLALGYAAMIGVNRGIIAPLRRAKNFANTIDDLVGSRGEVIEPVAEGGVGAVRLSCPSGAVIYAAVADGGGELAIGERVRVVAVENSQAVVRPLAERPRPPAEVPILKF